MKSYQKFIAALAVVCCTGLTLRAGDKKDIVDTAVAAGSFKTLAAALDAAGLVETLKGNGPFTVFAPTDDAFAKLPKGTVETLVQSENKDKLISILTYHVVSGKVKAKDVVKLNAAVTVNGQRIDIKVNDQVMVDNAKVVKTDIECSNGIIHVIDKVILPSSDNIPATAVKAGKFNTLVAAAKAAGLVDALSGKGPLTVFAPTDDAFAKLPKGTVESLLKPENKDQLVAILKYHVVGGRVFSDAALKAKKARTLQGDSVNINLRDSGAFINQAKLIATDIDASNGVIHVIDQVLLPPKKVSAADARQMIEHAVANGSKLYNAGHHQACADIYEKVVAQMVQHGGQMPAQAMHTLQTAMNKASSTHCANSKAWTLRHGLDEAYAVLADRSK